MAVTTDPSKTGISETDALALTGTTLAPNVVNASLNSITPTGGTLGVAGAQSIVSSDLGANLIRVVNDNGTAGVRTYTPSDGDGLILNQYYAVAGGPDYMRYADIVANMADVSATTMRFLVKGTGVDAAPVLVLDSGGAAVTGSISATGQVGASAFATTGYDASVYSAQLLLAGNSTANNFATFIATNGAGRTYYMGPGAGDGSVASFALYDNTSGAARWRSTATGFDVTGSISATDYIAGAEQTPPSAPAANGYRIFAQDNGAGKTQLMVLFASGAAQQIAIEP